MHMAADLYPYLIDKAPQGILVVRGDQVETHNPLARQILGLRERALPLEEFLSLVMVQDREFVRKGFCLNGSGHIPSTLSFRFLCDGRERWIKSSFVRVEIGSETLLLHFFIDDTEKEIAKEALLRTEKLAAVGTLAGGIAHEFNNLHAIVIGYLDLCLMQVEDPGIRGMLSNSLIACQRAAGITRNLLEFTQNKPSKRSITNLKQTVLETLTLLETEFTSEGIHIEKHLPDLPPMFIDSDQIAQVFLNFMINAKHAMISSEEKRIRIKMGENDGKVFLSVSDTGCGISKCDLARIFTPFFTTKGEHARPGSEQCTVKGTGLGLSVCESVAKAHGGEIHVESLPLKGSTFSLWIPLVQNEEGIKTFYMPTEKSLEKVVWVVDDEEMIRDIGVSCLADFFTTKGWENPQLALDALLRHHVDVVVLDIQMPQMSGHRFVEKLNLMELENPPKILVLTGRLGAGEIESFGLAGVHHFMEKPFGRLELIKRVQELLE